jgi:hypothetical protein
MAQRGHELATDLYIINQMYRNSVGPDTIANAVRRILVHLCRVYIACHINPFIQILIRSTETLVDTGYGGCLLEGYPDIANHDMIALRPPLLKVEMIQHMMLSKSLTASPRK